ncbi:MAG: tyrosine-type recombinase/integrase [Clostridia bacterium]|nr:tyrosine-type recombinase/integrase [Clostridia bacterium]
MTDILNLKHKLHDLRHTFGTLQICCNKIDVKTVSLWMGHSNIETTLKYYTHPEQLDKATFLRGDISESEKTGIYKAKYAEIIGIITDFLNDRTQNRTH